MYIYIYIIYIYIYIFTYMYIYMCRPVFIQASTVIIYIYILASRSTVFKRTFQDTLCIYSNTCIYIHIYSHTYLYT